MVEKYDKDTLDHVCDGGDVLRGGVEGAELLAEVVEDVVVGRQIQALGAGLRVQTLSQGQLTVSHEAQRLRMRADVERRPRVLVELHRQHSQSLPALAAAIGPT